MKIKKTASLIIATIITAGSAHAATISVNFDDGGNVVGGSLGAESVVGNWNSTNFGAAGSPVSTLNLDNDSGVATTTDIQLSHSSNTNAGGFASAGSGGSGDYADLYAVRGRNGGSIVAVSDIEYTNYEVHVYFGHNTDASGLTLTLTGATTGNLSQSVTTDLRANFLEATSANSHVGNYFVFEDVSGSSFNLAAGHFVYGIQIVETVPEPSSAALLGLGGLALILRRKK